MKEIKLKLQVASDFLLLDWDYQYDISSWLYQHKPFSDYHDTPKGIRKPISISGIKCRFRSTKDGMLLDKTKEISLTIRIDSEIDSVSFNKPLVIKNGKLNESVQFDVISSSVSDVVVNKNIFKCNSGFVLRNGEGRYLSEREVYMEGGELLSTKLSKLHKAVKGEDLSVNITILDEGLKPKLKSIKGVSVRSWSSVVKIEGDESIVKTAMVYGLGFNTAMGFGFIN